MKFKQPIVVLLVLFNSLVQATLNVCFPFSSSNDSRIILDNQKELDHLLHKLRDDLDKKLEPFTNTSLCMGDRLPLDIKHEAITATGYFDDLCIYNLDDYEICIDFTILSPFTLFNITFPKITLNGLYDLDGNIGELFAIFGNGHFDMEVKHFSIALNNVNFNVTDDICGSFNIDANMEEFAANFENFLNDKELEELFHRAFHAIVPEVFDILWNEFRVDLDDTIQGIIDEITHNNREVEQVFRRGATDPKHLFGLLPFCWSVTPKGIV